MKNEERAYDQALRYLSLRNHSRLEISEKLARKGYEKDIVEAVLERLARVGLIDDEKLAEQEYRRYIQEGVYGNSYIAYRMERKGLTPPRRMTSEEEKERALKLVQKRLLAAGKRVKRRKLASFLANRGYGITVMRAVCEALGDAVLLDREEKRNYNI